MYLNHPNWASASQIMYFKWFDGLDVIRILRGGGAIDPQIGKKSQKVPFSWKKGFESI